MTGQLCSQGVVVGDLCGLIPAQQVDTAVSNIGQVGHGAIDQGQRNGGAHLAVGTSDILDSFPEVGVGAGNSLFDQPVNGFGVQLATFGQRAGQARGQVRDDGADSRLAGKLAGVKASNAITDDEEAKLL